MNLSQVTALAGADGTAHLVILTAFVLLAAVKVYVDLREAKKRSLGDAARSLWALGQGIKPALYAEGKERDFPAVLKDRAQGVLARYGLPKSAMEELLQFARDIHKSEKAPAPLLVEDPGPDAEGNVLPGSP